MKKFIYIDNSNLFIEGQRAAAIGKQRQERGDNSGKTLDRNYKIDYGKLYRFVTQNGDDEIGRVLLVGSRPPPNDSLWAFAESVGFELMIRNRNVANKEKGVDTALAHEMGRDAYRGDGPTNHKILLVSGDGDYIPPVERLVQDGFTVEVVFWARASAELKRTCSKFIKLDAHLDKLALRLPKRNSSQ